MSEKLSEIQEYCKGCPVQCDLLNTEARLRCEYDIQERVVTNNIMDEEYTSSSIVELASRMRQQDAEQVVIDLRKESAEALEAQEKAIDDLDTQRRLFALTCNGILKMRTPKDETSYTVTVCTSPEVYGGVHQHIPTHITRAVL